jgi:hypothetical protein
MFQGTRWTRPDDMMPGAFDWAARHYGRGKTFADVRVDHGKGPRDDEEMARSAAKAVSQSITGVDFHDLSADGQARLIEGVKRFATGAVIDPPRQLMEGVKGSHDLPDDVGTVFIATCDRYPFGVLGRRNPENGELCPGSFVVGADGKVATDIDGVEYVRGAELNSYLIGSTMMGRSLSGY